MTLATSWTRPSCLQDRNPILTFELAFRKNVPSAAPVLMCSEVLTYIGWGFLSKSRVSLTETDPCEVSIVFFRVRVHR